MNEAATDLNDLHDRLISANLTTLEAAQETLNKLLGPEITARWEKINDQTTIRVLLTTVRSHAGFERKLERECSGVVLTYPGWDVISLPSPMLSHVDNLRSLNLATFTIYEVKDGTTVTLYYYNDQWCISSKNGFDVRGYCWIGPKTYLEVFTELSEQYPEFSLEKLDKSTSYTIGFHHHDFHPVTGDVDRMWLIQSAVGLNATVYTQPDTPMSAIGIPYQISTVNLGGTSNEIVNSITSKNTNSLSKYFATVNKKAEIHYGYILRSTAADYIVESELLKNVRLMLYNTPKIQYNSLTINAHNRRDFMILKAHLSYNTRYLFTSLFPQYKAKMAEYEKMLQQLVAKMIMILEDSKYPAKTALDGLAHQLVKYIKNAGIQINVLDPTSKSILEDFVNDRQYIELYFIWFEKNTSVPTSI